MATFNGNMPDDLTGNNEQDISNLHGCLSNTIYLLNSIINNLDDENLSEGIINKINEKGE